MTEGESFRCRARSCWEISKVERHFLIVEPGLADNVISPAIFSASSVRIGDRRLRRKSPVFDDCDLPKFMSAIDEELPLTGCATRETRPPRGRVSPRAIAHIIPSIERVPAGQARSPRRPETVRGGLAA